MKDQTRHGHSPSGKRCRAQMTDTTDTTVYQLILLEALGLTSNASLHVYPNDSIFVVCLEGDLKISGC